MAKRSRKVEARVWDGWYGEVTTGGQLLNVRHITDIHKGHLIEGGDKEIRLRVTEAIPIKPAKKSPPTKSRR